MPVHVDEEGSEPGRDAGRSWRRPPGNARLLLRGFCSGRSMFGGCRESDPNRFVSFVKGIWGVTTRYSGPQVLAEYWLSSQKGHSLKGTPAETATCRSPLHQQHPSLRTVGHQPSRCPNPPPEQPSRPPPATSPTASYIATLARSGTRPPCGTRSDLPPQRQGLVGLSESRGLVAVVRCGTGVWWRSRVIHVRRWLVCCQRCWVCWLRWRQLGALLAVLGREPLPQDGGFHFSTKT